MKKYLVLCMLCMAANFYGQKKELSFFDPLIGKTWKAEGNWGDGSKFKQEITFEYHLDSTLVVAQAKGFTDKEKTQFGPRNHGIRKYNQEANTIEFWEFDVFGGVTQGTVRASNKDIIYSYSYGNSYVTDMWEYVDSNTYNFKVGEYVDGKWKQTYLSTQFIAEPTLELFQFDHQSLAVSNLMKTGDFYRDVFDFKEIPHPAGKAGFRWFQIHGNTQLHLIEKEMAKSKKDKSVHLCFATNSLESLIEKLKDKGITFYDWPGNENSVSKRVDGIQQIYIQDPEGYWIEINDAQH